MNDDQMKPGDHSEALPPTSALPQMNGAAAQKSNAYTGQPDDLHDLFGTASVDEEDPLAALRNDPNYSALIRDLEYIATQARMLFTPAEEAPSDELWNKIQSKMAEAPAEPEAE